MSSAGAETERTHLLAGASSTPPSAASNPSLSGGDGAMNAHRFGARVNEVLLSVRFSTSRLRSLFFFLLQLICS